MIAGFTFVLCIPVGFLLCLWMIYHEWPDLYAELRRRVYDDDEK